MLSPTSLLHPRLHSSGSSARVSLYNEHRFLRPTDVPIALDILSLVARNTNCAYSSVLCLPTPKMDQRITRSSAAEQASGNTRETRSNKSKANHDTGKGNAKGSVAAAKMARGKQKEKEKEELTSRE